MPQLTGNRSQRHLTWMPMSIQMMTQMMMTMSQTSRVIICLVLHLVLSLRLAHTPHERQRPRPSLILLLAACRVVDVGDGETVSLATSDVLGLADVPVTLPDRLWAECLSRAAQRAVPFLAPSCATQTPMLSWQTALSTSFLLLTSFAFCPRSACSTNPVRTAAASRSSSVAKEPSARSPCSANTTRGLRATSHSHTTRRARTMAHRNQPRVGSNGRMEQNRTGTRARLTALRLRPPSARRSDHSRPLVGGGPNMRRLPQEDSHLAAVNLPIELVQECRGIVAHLPPVVHTTET
jgi:hypothetical protein